VIYFDLDEDVWKNLELFKNFVTRPNLFVIGNFANKKAHENLININSLINQLIQTNYDYNSTEYSSDEHDILCSQALEIALQIAEWAALVLRPEARLLNNIDFTEKYHWQNF
jgi:hypothetical protein